MSDYSSQTATVERPSGVAWDYSVKTIHARLNEVFQDQLRNFGREGWELVFVNMPVQCEFQCIFRRPMPQ
jgi:hypothetical protein